jgi:hypothetical protein
MIKFSHQIPLSFYPWIKFIYFFGKKNPGKIKEQEVKKNIEISR